MYSKIKFVIKSKRLALVVVSEDSRSRNVDSLGL